MRERPYGFPALPDSWTAGPATRHARPVALGDRPARPRDDSPTDPVGFPPLSVALRPPGPPTPRPAAAEAAAVAAAFAADFLSWDEDDRARRGWALADHLAPSADDPAMLGWSGTGRQRAEFALPGEVWPDGDDRVVVDVRVRVTPYRAVGDRAGGDEPAELAVDVPGVAAAAPAPTAQGWRDLASYWVRMTVPVTSHDDRLVVDAGDEVALPGPGDVEVGDEAAGGVS
jgi:hypothetical protein